MTARQIQQWQQLTGQSQHTLRYMRLTIDLNHPSITHTRTTTERGIKWASRYFEYHVTQLLDLRPRGPVTSQAPFDGEPPPNLLLGYFYVAKVLNNYLFDQRTYSSLAYTLYLSPATYERRMIWQILTDCSYIINTGSYWRAIQSSQDFASSITQIQNAVLMDRILSSLQRGDMQGFGLAISQQNDGRYYSPERNAPFSHSFRLCGLDNRDAKIVNSICDIKRALCNFLILSNNEDCSTICSLPFTDDWITHFIEEFKKIEIPRNECNIPLRDLATVLTLGKGGFKGGALTLRSGTRLGLPFILRQREQRRAITESIRKKRGQNIKKFIDTLPSPRRRPRTVETVENETIERDIQSASEIEDEIDSDRESETSGLSRNNFNDEIIATIVDLIQNLEDELTSEARRSNFFTYGREFFQLLVKYYNQNRLSEEFIQKWLIYFFILEHIASTLYYLHLHFNDRFVRRNIGIQFAQVILRGRNDIGEEIFTRVWFNRENSALKRLYERILTDMIGIIDVEGKDVNFDNFEERDQLLQDIQFIENSGSIEEVFSQINTSFSQLDSVELAFRIKFSGIVAYSTNPVVLRSFERTRQAALNRWLQRQ
ncbi:pDNA terminal protein [Odocoileus adenovirus 1]|uniref:PDNA terminal protein n=2 Tax=Deer atadenovirus A TaxID=2169706 RepID=A0A223PYU5_9ADEN|nr:pDNA terminal protein [Odocoileus adenovirus 1]QDM55317.1 pDNA terminal protein [Deer atadenovirus A]ASU50471.1 pDNA terminal protein [Odocoileus adenovirus 1]ASU50498.1 pDNA terminal protein [Odocoileus adenovirus 1]ASU50525.1 pDNA terminal protein [Odocoileus adenovirus 1]ASU50552.1 pDNA terminal protein [Odocoileus adenovirus 1]